MDVFSLENSASCTLMIMCIFWNVYFTSLKSKMFRKKEVRQNNRNKKKALHQLWSVFNYKRLPDVTLY